jgi:hypothetical protein
VYPIDLQTILQVLANQSGELRTTVKHVANIKGECQVSVMLSLGKVVSCTILQKGKPVLIGEEAFHLLVNAGILQWEYIPAPSPPPRLGSERSMGPSGPLRTAGLSEMSPARQAGRGDLPSGVFPVQARAVSREEFATWPRLYRSIYQLSTGDKTVEDIARLLSVPTERVKTALLSLIQQKSITLR